ncbi:hypothetical protein CFOL_v3_03032 [Cephalotus follicularis]|uniref:U5 small nuclear ribonucleoprotein TSSC4 n=1 Tax=Cephalotus follicularis TaxID=3775 RepID=A0A1Q3AUU8_CEPFO|nr:hypothetical protein CFOL_v3_03032 [Cephalotus follicularis]
MEDSLKVRLDKAFGSLSSTTPSPSLWSLNDGEIQRDGWIRDKGSPEPETHPFCSWNQQYRKEMEKDLDEEEEEEESRSRDASIPEKPFDDYDDEQWLIKSSIGLDSTLDYEEEEDEFDKMADGKDLPKERLYLKDINDYETDADLLNELPTSFKGFTRDMRANHMAAKIRLREDAEAAKHIHSLHVSEGPAADAIMYAAPTAVKLCEDSILKSILKRKDNQPDTNENQLDLKSQKRVRFDAGSCDEDAEGAQDRSRESCFEEEAVVSNDTYAMPPDYPSGIPDYMRNPTKYTRYTFDSTDMDEESNWQAYMDFLKLKSSNMDSQSNDSSVELPKSVTFVPKKKKDDTTIIECRSESKQDQVDDGKSLPIGIASRNGDNEIDGDVCAMEEDEPKTIDDKRNSLQKLGRQYRMKSGLEESDEYN